MVVRISALCAVALLLAVAVAAPASAQQISPGGPDAQISEYVAPAGGAGAAGEPGPPGAPGPSGEAGAAGELAFTGLTLLPLALIGVGLVSVAVALRRRPPRSATV
jgi:hypothetical protein